MDSTVSGNSSAFGHDSSFLSETYVISLKA